MPTIKQDDVIQSVADALQYISYYHSPDFIQAMSAAYEREQSPAAKDAIKQILVNSRMCAPGHRHRHRVREGRHEREVGCDPEPRRDDQRGRAPGLQPSRQQAARFDRL